MPVEDPTVEWKSPFIKVATLKLPSQTIDSPEQLEFCENLSFNPWHSLPEHEPLGGINRPRKQVYQELLYWITRLCSRRVNCCWQHMGARSNY